VAFFSEVSPRRRQPHPNPRQEQPDSPDLKKIVTLARYPSPKLVPQLSQTRAEHACITTAQSEIRPRCGNGSSADRGLVCGFGPTRPELRLYFSGLFFYQRRAYLLISGTPEGLAMTTFDDRENAFENKYAYDEEMKFRAQARCNKLLGLWAAELLGKTGDDADAYAKEVVLSDFEEAGHEDVVRKVAGDLGDLADADTIRGKMAELLRVAKAQLVKES